MESTKFEYEFKNGHFKSIYLHNIYTKNKTKLEERAKIRKKIHTP